MPPGGGKYNGKLTVTNRRLLYDAKFDVSVKGMLAEALTIKWGSEGYLEIDKGGSIQGVEVQKKLLSKKCILTLTDGSKHTFDYEAMNIDKTSRLLKPDSRDTDHHFGRGDHGPLLLDHCKANRFGPQSGAQTYPLIPVIRFSRNQSQ